MLGWELLGVLIGSHQGCGRLLLIYSHGPHEEDQHERVNEELVFLNRGKKRGLDEFGRLL